MVSGVGGGGEPDDQGMLFSALPNMAWYIIARFRCRNQSSRGFLDSSLVLLLKRKGYGTMVGFKPMDTHTYKLYNTLILV